MGTKTENIHQNRKMFFSVNKPYARYVFYFLLHFVCLIFLTMIQLPPQFVLICRCFNRIKAYAHFVVNVHPS